MGFGWPCMTVGWKCNSSKTRGILRTEGFCTLYEGRRDSHTILLFRYVRALGAMYFRLIGTSAEIYNYLEPLYNDYRKLRFMNRSGSKSTILIVHKGSELMSDLFF